MKLPHLVLLGIVLCLAGCARRVPDNLLDLPREAVLDLGRNVVGVLEEGLANGDPLIQRKSAVRLGIWAGAKGDDDQKTAAARALQPLLKAEDSDVRLEVLASLGQIGPPAVAVIVAGLDDPAADIRGRAVQSLILATQGGLVQSPPEPRDLNATMAVLGRAMQDEDADVRASVVDGLGSFGVRGTAEKWVSQASERGDAFGAQPKQAIVELLEQGLNDDVRHVCRAAAVSFWQFGPEMASYLEAALESDNVASRQGTLLAVTDLPFGPTAVLDLGPERSEGNLPDPEEVARITQLVEKGRQDEDCLVRVSAGEAAMALVPDEIPTGLIPDLPQAARRGDAEFQGHLFSELGISMILIASPEQKQAMAEELGKAAEEIDLSVVEGATGLMSSLGGYAIPTFAKLLDSEKRDTRAAAVKSLAAMLVPDRRGYESHVYTVTRDDEVAAMRVVAKALEDEDFEVKRYAIVAGRHLRSHPVPDAVIPAIEIALATKEGRPFVESAASYVARRGTGEQKETLTRVLENLPADADLDIQTAAKEALGALQEKENNGRRD